MNIELGKKYRIKPQKYFQNKYGEASPLIDIEELTDFHLRWTPGTFLYLGRALQADLPVENGLHYYYGHVNSGEGEIVHESELVDL